MVSLAELRAQVAASYDRLGMPSWPNPHPGMTRPREEEYSRVTEPERYRVVHARARVWAGRLGDLPGVEVETLAPGPVDDEGHSGRYDRGVRLASPLPDRLPLLLLERDGQWAGPVPSPAVLHISVVRPQITLEMLPAVLPSTPADLAPVLPATRCHATTLAARPQSQDRNGSRVHCDSLDGGARLCPCGLATATPQHVTVASDRTTHESARSSPTAGHTSDGGCAPLPAHIRQVQGRFGF